MKSKKYLLAAAAGVIVATVLVAPTGAIAAASSASVTITEADGLSGEAMRQAVHTAIPYPTDIQLFEQGGRTYLHKTYTVAANYDPDILVEAAFSQGGYRYRFSEIIHRESIPASSSKTVMESKSVSSDSGDRSIILSLLGNKLPYSDADGYMGELFLLPESLVVSETGRTSYTYTVTDTQRYEGLANNDMANIPKTVSKNGLTLQLQTVDWSVTGRDGTGYGGFPTGYTAIAYYSAPSTGTKATGYLATASYSGAVSKELVGKNVYTIVYEGEQIVIPFNYYPLIAPGLIIAGCIVACAVLWRLRKNVEVYVYQAGVPELYTKLQVSLKEPVIELRQLSDVEVRLMFDRHFAKRLLDQRVFVVSKFKNTRFDLNGMRVVDLWLPGEKNEQEEKA